MATDKLQMATDKLQIASYVRICVHAGTAYSYCCVHGLCWPFSAFITYLDRHNSCYRDHACIVDYVTWLV